MNRSQCKPSLSKLRILLIEDEIILKKNIRLHLDKEGYETIAASTAKEARDILEIRSVGIILLDIGLPDCNGLDLLEEIEESMPKVPVIVMSAQDTLENKERAKRLGASAFFKKPIILKHLKETIHAVHDMALPEHEKTLKASPLLGHMPQQW